MTTTPSVEDAVKTAAEQLIFNRDRAREEAEAYDTADTCLTQHIGGLIPAPISPDLGAVNAARYLLDYAPQFQDRVREEMVRIARDLTAAVSASLRAQALNADRPAGMPSKEAP